MFNSSNIFKIIMKLNKIKYGKNLRLIGFPVIYQKRGSDLIIGDNCIIKSSFLSNLVGLSQKTIIITRLEKSKVVIGNNVGISGATIYSRDSIFIGDNTQIGGNVKILDNDFHPIDSEKRRLNDTESIKAKKIVIGNDCFIGCNSIILKGTVLGDKSVVGAGSVVCGKFPSGVIVAGNPAKIIKRI